MYSRQILDKIHQNQSKKNKEILIHSASKARPQTTCFSKQKIFEIKSFAVHVHEKSTQAFIWTMLCNSALKNNPKNSFIVGFVQPHALSK